MGKEKNCLPRIPHLDEVSVIVKTLKKNTSFNCFSHTEIILKQVFKECALEKKKNSEDIGCLKLWCNTIIIMSKNVRNSKWTLKIQINVYVYYKPIIILG